MTSLAWPDRWPDLSGLGPTEANGSDARAALLKVNAEMFVAAPARDRDVIDTFETLALGFLPTVDHATLMAIARILAPCPDTPASVLAALARHSPEARETVMREAAHLPEPVNDALLASPEGRLRMAGRPKIDAAEAASLLPLREAAVEDALAANSGLAPGEAAMGILVRRARERPSLAAHLLARGDLSLVDEAALYLVADPPRRDRIRERVVAATALQRATVVFTLSEHDVAEFLAAARKGDDVRVEALLTSAFGFPEGTDWRILQLGRHLLLALALKALGLAERDALRVLLSLHPALSRPLSAVKGLCRAMRETPAPASLALVEAILGVQALTVRALARRS